MYSMKRGQSVFMGQFEVIVNPVSTIALCVMLLISTTAIAFIAVLFACGLQPNDIMEAEEP